MRRLNPKSLIQPSETLPIELIKTHAPSKTLGPLQLTIIQPKKLNINNKNIHNVDFILAKKKRILSPKNHVLLKKLKLNFLQL